MLIVRPGKPGHFYWILSFKIFVHTNKSLLRIGNWLGEPHQLKNKQKHNY
jgi:hypothetical protein